MIDETQILNEHQNTIPSNNRVDDNADFENYSKQELYELAFYESVTKHHNWNWMRDRLANFENYGIDKFAFVHFDIKDFKMINEIYGHSVGDKLLQKICTTMKNTSWVYFSCRCDNDNFAMVIKDAPEEVLEKELADFFDSLSHLDQDPTYNIYFRCGVACISDVENYRVIITDMAKLAQRLGESVNATDINFYTDEMKEDTIKGKLIKNDLSRAIEEDELLVYYQPKFNPTTNDIIGAEALIRWNYNHSVLWAPGKFVPFLEKEGSIEIIDYFVLEAVCKKLEEWKKTGKKMIPISVNMSKMQLHNQNVIGNIMNIVNKYDVDPKYIEFELTETLAYDDSKYMLLIMEKLRECGFQLSLDDFGTGYSSLNMLSLMPLTTLKIDKSFVDSIGLNNDGKICWIIKDILSMSKHLQIKSVAEGVETKEQKDLIEEWGCDSIQGYYYSKPLCEQDFEQLLNK